MYLLVDIAKTVALQVVVEFQRAAEVLHFTSLCHSLQKNVSA